MGGFNRAAYTLPLYLSSHHTQNVANHSENYQKRGIIFASNLGLSFKKSKWKT